MGAWKSVDLSGALGLRSYGILRRPMNYRISKAALLGLLVAACGESTVSGGGGPSEAPSVPGGSGDVPGGTLEPGPGDAAGSNPNTRLVRLSHAQYANTLRELLGIDDTPEASFAPDALNGFKFDTSNDLRVDPRLGPQYRTAAEQLAARVVSDEDLFERIVPCEADAEGCASEFIEAFGARAFRRPLASAESARFQSLFGLAASVSEGEGNAFQQGVGLVVEAMLQSPQFLYRAEVSHGSVSEGRAPLDDWEVASRLSYFIYDSMPDESLFERAREGELHTPDQVGAEVARMLDDPRAAAKLSSFHEQAWQVGRYAKISPDRETFPDLPDDLVDHLRASQQRFVEAVVEDGGGLRELLTAPYAFVDSQIASLYETDVDGDDLERVDFDDGERKGFLMQAGFLASNAYARKTDPIHRGVFILRDVLCRDIPDPPADAAQTPLPETDEPIETTREEITLLTGQLYCPGCHSQINEPGFSFEGFDAVGRPRERENGVEVDTSGSITLDGEEIDFSGAGELVEALAASEEAQRCYNSRWLEFAYGRELTERDDVFRDRLGATQRGVRELIEELVTAPEFLSRDASEEAP